MDEYQEKVMFKLCRYLGGQVTPEALEWLHDSIQKLKKGPYPYFAKTCRRLENVLENAGHGTKHQLKDHCVMAITIICNLSYGWEHRTAGYHWPIDDVYWTDTWEGRNLRLRKQMIDHICDQIQDIIDNWEEYANEYAG